MAQPQRPGRVNKRRNTVTATSTTALEVAPSTSSRFLPPPPPTPQRKQFNASALLDSSLDIDDTDQVTSVKIQIMDQFKKI